MRSSLLVVLLALLLGGCLEFDAQDLAIRYDGKADRIDIQVVYRGLFAEGGTGSTEKPVEKALKDLQEVRQNGTILFWCNWPMTVDLTDDRPAPIAALLAHVDVENGALFTDPQGVLCGYQFVRIRHAKAFLQKLNTLLELGLQAKVATAINGYGPDHKVDEDTRDILREFFRAGEKLLVLEPGRMELRLPCSPKDHAWLKEQIEQHLLNNMPREVVRRSGVAARRAGGGDVGDTDVADASVQIPGNQLKADLRQSASYRFFWDNEWTFVREPELTRIGLGVAGQPELRIRKASEGLYHDSFLVHLREIGETIEDGLPDQELERRFEQFRARDAALPPMLAEKRKAAAAPTESK